MSSVVDIRTLDCTTPGCPGEAAGRVCDLPFCQTCLDAEPHKVLRGVAQRAEMRRQATLAAEKAARERLDELAERRARREREAVEAARLAARTATRRQLDGRTSAVLTLQRMLRGAQRRHDDLLEAGLREALDALAAELVRTPRQVA